MYIYMYIHTYMQASYTYPNYKSSKAKNTHICLNTYVHTYACTYIHCA